MSMNVAENSGYYTANAVAGVTSVTGSSTAGKADAVSAVEREDASTSATQTDTTAVVYDKSETSDKSQTSYSKNKMTAGERALLVDKLKAEQQKRQEQLVDLVNKMVSNQTNAYGKAKGLKQYLQSNLDKVDEKTRLQAQQDISEDGYYGVKQTSQRLFDFASALAGDDVENMKKMQAAIEKGYKQAEKKWGGTLPGICQSTLEATNQLFDDYYKSAQSSATE